VTTPLVTQEQDHRNDDPNCDEERMHDVRVVFLFAHDENLSESALSVERSLSAPAY